MPGLLLAVLFSLVVFFSCLYWPRLDGAKRRFSWYQRCRGLVAMLPPLLLFTIVVGSIYAGLATPTEAAALGVLAALVLALIRRRLTLKGFMAALDNTMRTTCMVMLIVLAAFFLNFVMVSIGLTAAITDSLKTTDVAPLIVMLLLIATYLLLGCFMETLSLMIATTPIVVPIIIALGYDPVWFGIFS